MKISQIMISVLLATVLYSPSLFSMFCPTNFNNIKIGDPILQVQLQCGKPNVQKTYKLPPDLDLTPQEWIYIIPPYPGKTQNGMRLSILFKNKKATSITVNGTGRGETQICNDQSIKVGSTMDTIKKACGSHRDMVNKTTQPNEIPSEVEMTEFKYINIPTPTTLIFENGKLKERK